MANASSNLITYILKFCDAIYQMIYGSAVEVMHWFETFENATGFNPLELMLGAGLTALLAGILIKWILDIWPG